MRRPSSQCPTCGSQRASAYLSPGCLPCTPKRGTPSILFRTSIKDKKVVISGIHRGSWTLLLLLWAGHSGWQLRPSFTLRASLLWSRHKHRQKDCKETGNVDYIDTHVEHQTIMEHTKHISTIASALHTFCSNLLTYSFLVFLCCVHDCTLNGKCDVLNSVFKRYSSEALLFFIFHPLQLCLTPPHHWVLPTNLPGWKTASSLRRPPPGWIDWRRTWPPWQSGSTRRSGRANDFRSCWAAVGSRCPRTSLTPNLNLNLNLLTLCPPPLLSFADHQTCFQMAAEEETKL